RATVKSVPDYLMGAKPKFKAEIVTDRHNAMESCIVTHRPRKHDQHTNHDRSHQPRPVRQPTTAVTNPQPQPEKCKDSQKSRVGKSSKTGKHYEANPAEGAHRFGQVRQRT